MKGIIAVRFCTYRLTILKLEYMIKLKTMTNYELADERSAAIKKIKRLESTSQAMQDKLTKPLYKIIAACEKEMDNR